MKKIERIAIFTKKGRHLRNAYVHLTQLKSAFHFEFSLTFVIFSKALFILVIWVLCIISTHTTHNRVII